jgi:hypothetical protein
MDKVTGNFSQNMRLFFGLHLDKLFSLIKVKLNYQKEHISMSLVDG